jgi:hypothetical protein
MAVSHALLGFAILAALAAVPSAQFSPRWPPGYRIPVWIGESSERVDDPLMVERAMRVWSDAAAGRFTLARTTDAAAARVRVRFATGDATFGEASPVADRSSGFITGADIAIAANLEADPLLQRVIIYLTALHELGHALGLRHTSRFDDIMYLFRRPDAVRRRIRTEADIGAPGATGLSEGDLVALRALYGE